MLNKFFDVVAEPAANSTYYITVKSNFGLFHLIPDKEIGLTEIHVHSFNATAAVAGLYSDASQRHEEDHTLQML